MSSPDNEKIKNIEGKLLSLNSKINKLEANSNILTDLGNTKYDISGFTFYQTVIFKDDNLSVGDVLYGSISGYPSISLTYIPTMRFIYVNTLYDRFFVTRNHQYISGDGVVNVTDATDTFYGYGIFVFDRVYMRNESDSFGPGIPYFNLVAILSM